MDLRMVFGLVFAAGYVLLVYDLLTIAKRAGAAKPATTSP
jgi:hypothetical protein